VREHYVREGILLGLAFVLANLLFDLCMFSVGPMQMPLFRYFKEIGIAYSIMPIISFGIAWTLAWRCNCPASKQSDVSFHPQI
jgi:hypothetical protein